MNDDEALRKAFAALRDSVNLAFSRWKATGHIDDDVRSLMEVPVVAHRTSGFKTFGDAVAAQATDSVVMRAICRHYLGEPGQPWDYECVLSLGHEPTLLVRGYHGVTRGNVRDLRDRGFRWVDPKVSTDDNPDSGFGF